MKNQLAVSSFSLRQALGPIRISRREPDGVKREVLWGDQPATMTLLEFPGQVREKLGLDAVEICQFHLPERSDAYVDRLERALDDARVSLVNVPIDVGNISDADERQREEDLAEIEGWLGVAARLGSRMARVNASAPLSQAPLAPLDVTIASYSRLASAAREHGLQLLIENHGGITDDFDVILRIVQSVGLDRLMTLVDVGNHPSVAPIGRAQFEGKEPPEVDPAPLYRDLPKLVPFAGLVHAKSAGLLPDGRPGWDTGRALRAVRDAGYAGPISLELGGTKGNAWDEVRELRSVVEAVFA